MAFIRQAPLLRCLPLVVLCILTPTLVQTIHQDAMFTPPMICDYNVKLKKADCHDRVQQYHFHLGFFFQEIPFDSGIVS